MKKLLVLLLALLLCFASFANAAIVTFTWDASSGAVGYRAFCGSATGVYAPAPVFDLIGAPIMNSFAVTTFSPGVYFCALKAYVPAGAICAPSTAPNQNCSGLSNEVSFPIPLMAPGNFRITITLTWNPTTQSYAMKVAKAAIP